LHFLLFSLHFLQKWFFEKCLLLIHYFHRQNAMHEDRMPFILSFYKQKYLKNKSLKAGKLIAL